MSEEYNKIEDIKRKLYDHKDNVTHRTKEGVIHPIKHEVKESWDHNNIDGINMKKPKTSIFKKFFILSIIFFIGALLFAFFMFNNGGSSVSNDNIDIIVIGNAFVKGGEELPLQIEVINRNKSKLELSNLQISYPNGASNNESDYVRLPRIAIGTILPGQTITKNIKVVLFGDEKSNRLIKIELDYHPEGSNAIFTKEKEYSVNISSAPISLLIKAPETTTTDQQIEFSVLTTLNTTLPDKNTLIELTYPNNFIFENALPEPIFGNSVWSLEELSLSNPIEIKIKGRIIGEDGEQQVFRIFSGTSSFIDRSKIDTVYNSALHSIAIIKPFIEAKILANDTASTGENIRVRILWANNLPSRITDAQIIANIGGNALDKSSITTNDGFYDSLNNKIVWEKNSNRDLLNIEPGQRGEVYFNVKSIPLIGGDSKIKEPQISIDVSIKGKQPNYGSNFADVDNFSRKIIKIVSDFQIVASAYHKSGPLPPTVEKETLYDINWIISNSHNSINNAVARAELPLYVKYKGVVSNRENITYNESTREVIWNIGSVKSNLGGNTSREAIFTVSIIPSLSQFDSIPLLVKDLYLSGSDLFTGTVIKNRKSSVNTEISDDPNYRSGIGRVIK